MPVAQFKCVREVSSEDKNFSASNLILSNTRKWKTREVGEKLAYVILELERPARITGIDIGNEHSAFVEVLVSSSSCRTEDFKEILITCSFMTPIESRNSSNPNRVRCFNKAVLVESVANEKWNLVKVICTQPFNKHVQYGLSFIKLHIAEEEIIKKNVRTNELLTCDLPVQKKITDEKDVNNEAKNQTSNKLKKLANFSLREESPDSDTESSLQLFSRWKKSREKEHLSTSVPTIREISTSQSKLRKSTEGLKKTLPFSQNTSLDENLHLEIPDRNRVDLLFGAEENNQNEVKKLTVLSKHIEAEREQLRIQRENLKQKVKKPEKSTKELKEEKKMLPRENLKQKIKKSGNSTNELKEILPTKKQKLDIPLKYRPFNQLLQGVVLAISGIQNPERSNLRDKALAMGAKYKVDWDADCTHLICAFKNTPKFNKVKGKGKIVKKIWIEKCFELKKYLPWRRYALESNEEIKPESDSEILADTLKQKKNEENVGQGNDINESCADETLNIESGSDTDDDIERIENKTNINNSIRMNNDVFDATTDEEEFIQLRAKHAKNSFTFFKDMKFFIDSNLPQITKDQLKRCIMHYGGSVAQESCVADFFIADVIPETCQTRNFNCDVVRSQWIFDCNDKEQKLPLKTYLISK